MKIKKSIPSRAAFFPDERALLQISANTPCILLERFSYEKDVLSEYTKSIVRGDKYTFQIEFQIAQTEPASD